MFATFRVPLLPLALLMGAALALSIGIVGATGPAFGQSDTMSANPNEEISTEDRSLEQAWQNFQEFSAEQARAADEAANNLLAAMDRELEELDARMETAGEGSREALEARREDLRQQRMALAERLDTVGEDSQSAWESLTEGIGDGFDSFTDAVARAWADMT